MSETTPLRAPLVIEYPFTRTVGPVQSAFLTGLREGVVLGIKRSDGAVLVPPVEYDPDTAEELTELVEVAETGTVATWAWEPNPDERQPLDTPFAWALVKLDGADTPHAARRRRRITRRHRDRHTRPDPLGRRA